VFRRGSIVETLSGDAINSEQIMIHATSGSSEDVH
jgi:hypothetical protein